MLGSSLQRSDTLLFVQCWLWRVTRSSGVPGYIRHVIMLVQPRESNKGGNGEGGDKLLGGGGGGVAGYVRHRLAILVLPRESNKRREKLCWGSGVHKDTGYNTSTSCYDSLTRGERSCVGVEGCIRYRVQYWYCHIFVWQGEIGRCDGSSTCLSVTRLYYSCTTTVPWLCWSNWKHSCHTLT